MKSTIRLFRALPIIEKKTKLPSKELLEKTIKKGFIFSPEIVYNYNDYDKLITLIEKEVGLTPEKLNSTFHKSWQKVKEASMEQLVMEQLVHYFTTYGFEALRIYDKDSVYIPNEQLEIPSLVVDELKLVIIKGYTKEELKKKLMDILSSGIALKEQTIIDVVELGSFVSLDEQDIEKIKNKEVKITLYNKLKVVPQNPVEFLRYVLFKITGNTLLIKSPETITKIRESMEYGVTVEGQIMRNTVADLFAKLDKSQLCRLAEVFYRFKPLFLSLRADSRLRPYVNKIRKLAKVYHKPLPEDYLNTITSKLKKDIGIDTYQLNKELSKVNIFRKIRLAYALKYRTKSPESILYKIRNGKGYATKFNFDNSQGANDVLDLFIMESIINDMEHNVRGKKIYIPDYITYTLPATEKQFVDKFPSGTCISVPKDMVAGIYWKNTPRCRVDLDLSLISREYGKVGWDRQYRTDDTNILFSGDMTDAPLGATELFYIAKQGEQSSIVVVNYYNWSHNKGNTGVPFKIIVASENIKNLKENYVVNPNNVIAIAESSIVKGQKILGLIVTTKHESKFYFTEANVGSSITSRNTNYMVNSRNYLFDFSTDMITLNDILEKAGAVVTNKQDDCDIDLSPENIEKDSILNLIKK